MKKHTKSSLTRTVTDAILHTSTTTKANMTKAFQGKRTTIAQTIKSQPLTKSAELLLEETPRERRNRLQRERYANDPEFRARAIAAVKSWDQRHPEKVRGYARRSAQRRRDAQAAQGLNSRGQRTAVITGSIYMAQVEGDTAVKIGYSTEGRGKKLSKIQMYHHRKVNMIYYSDDVVAVNILEQALHKKYESKNIRGEWFNLKPTNIKEIKTLVNKRLKK